MPNEKILYNIDDGKVRELSGSSYDSSTNKLTLKKISFTSASINLPDGIVFGNNNLLSSSAYSNSEFLLWSSSENKWKFSQIPTIASLDSITVPNGSDVTGTFSNLTAKSLSNVSIGTLSVKNGGTGLSTNDFPSSGESILVGNGINNLVAKASVENITNPVILEHATSTIGYDDSKFSNMTRLIRGQITTAPAGLFGGNALSSSYSSDTNNYTGYVDMPYRYNGDFTAECWTYLSNVGSTVYSISRATILVTNNDFAITLGGASQNGTSGTYNLWNSTTDIQTTLSFIPNQWVHLALVRNNNILKLYVNGTGSSNYTITNTDINDSGRMYIGGNSNGNWNINGYISEVSFYTYPKSESQIISYYNSIKNVSAERYTASTSNKEMALIVTGSMTIDQDGNIKYKTISRAAATLPSTVFSNY